MWPLKTFLALIVTFVLVCTALLFRKTNIQVTYGPFEKCAKIERTYVKPNMAARLTPMSKSIIVFDVDGRSCDFIADDLTWAKAKVGEAHIVSGAVRNDMSCVVKKMGGSC